jgi:di/tricarboxylate transporter
VTRDQVIIFGILAGMMTLFLWDRFRYDIVALLALLAAVLTGVVPADKAFTGFSNQVIPLIAGALVVSAAVGARPWAARGSSRPASGTPSG